jgi:hypothetical protein
MIWTHISVTTTYVLWREEHLWNVCVLQRVRLSNLVYSKRTEISHFERRCGVIRRFWCQKLMQVSKLQEPLLYS